MNRAAPSHFAEDDARNREIIAAAPASRRRILARAKQRMLRAQTALGSIAAPGQVEQLRGFMRAYGRIYDATWRAGLHAMLGIP